MLLCAAGLIGFSGCQSIDTYLNGMQTVGLQQPVWQKAYSSWTPEDTAGHANEPRSNRSVVGTELTVAGVGYETGIGFGGDGLLVYAPDGKGAYLKFLAGIDDRTIDDAAQARVTVYGDNREIAAVTVGKYRDPRLVQVPVGDINQLQFVIEADDQTYTDILLPRLTGVPGLRLTLEEGRTHYEDTIYAPREKIEKTRTLPNGSVMFPLSVDGYGPCIGLSNSLICIVIAPDRDARVIHCGPTIAGVAEEAYITQSLQPVDRRISTGVSESETRWKWRVEPDGQLRLLGPIDIAHGIRWSKTFIFVPDLPAAYVTLMVKNSVKNDVSWSMGTDVVVHNSSALILPRENVAPGYSLQTGNDNGIVSDENYVLVSRPNRRGTPAQGVERVLTTSAGSWVALLHDSYSFLLKASQPVRGLYPYNGAPVRIIMENGVTTAMILSEINPLSPGEFSTQEQFWVVWPRGETTDVTVGAAQETAAKAESWVTTTYKPPKRSTKRIKTKL